MAASPSSRPKSEVSAEKYQWTSWFSSKRGSWLSLPVAVPLFPPAAHIRTWSRVSGSRRARRPPPTNAEDANRMGTTLVIPTKDAKMELPRMAPILQSPLRMPNAVALRGSEKRSSEQRTWGKSNGQVANAHSFDESGSEWKPSTRTH